MIKYLEVVFMDGNVIWKTKLTSSSQSNVNTYIHLISPIRNVR